MISISQEQMTTLRDYLQTKLEGKGDEYNLFFEYEDDKIVWLSRSSEDDPRIILITLQEGLIEAQR